jgi:hypothetical protein
MGGTINTSSYSKETVKVHCTDSGKTVVAELIRMEKDKIIVILPGFIKMILHKTNKPHFYTTNQSGLEFTCDTKAK